MKKGNYKRNTLKRKLEQGAIATIANGPNNSNMCDLIGQFGFDAAFVDFEHGGVSWSELSDISRACELWDMASVVRVNTLEPSLILRTLDLGASSIMVPHIITVNDAEIAAKSCRYPPLGIRGVAGSRRAYGVDNYFDVANQEVQCIALIEDHEAVINLPKLVKVSGIDVFYVAPSDMAASMGKSHVLMKASDPKKNATASDSKGRLQSQPIPGGSSDRNKLRHKERLNTTKGRANTCGCRSPSKKLKKGNSVIV